MRVLKSSLPTTYVTVSNCAVQENMSLLSFCSLSNINLTIFNTRGLYGHLNEKGGGIPSSTLYFSCRGKNKEIFVKDLFWNRYKPYLDL